jgi:MerR family transcriptional regulator, light-induced transcriptional regulator
MQRVVKGEQTVTATRFAALTGVSRERLRTWERRYGFPEPHRTDAGPRRYAMEDVQRVVAVRRAAEAGVPIPRAIERTRYDEAPAHLASHIFAALVEHAPVPVAALSGPAPLRVEFVNGALRTLPGAPRPGEELTTALPAFYDSPCVLALQQLFATAGGPTEAEHPAWGGDARQVARSALFRLPSEPDARPLVAMVGLEGEGERVARGALAELQREVEHLRRRDERHTRWLDALALVAEEFRREPGRVAVDNGLDVVLRHTNALDGAVAFYVSGQLVMPSSRRGLLESNPVTVSAHPELARCLRDAEPTWLDAAASSAIGVPPDLHASAIPIVVAGETMGLLVFVFADVEPHDEDNGRLLTAVSAAMGFALLRDRLAQELREAAGAPG